MDAAEATLRANGLDVISPANLDRARGFRPHDLPEDWDWNTLPDSFDRMACILDDVTALLSCEAIVLLPGWQESRGARLEREIAIWAGLKVAELLDGSLRFVEPESEPSPASDSASRYFAFAASFCKDALELTKRKNADYETISCLRILAEFLTIITNEYKNMHMV